MSEINKINNFIKDVEENDWDESEYKVLLKEAILIIKYFCNEAYLCPHCDSEVTLEDLENSKKDENKEDDYDYESEDEEDDYDEDEEDEDDYDYEDAFTAADGEETWLVDDEEDDDDYV